MSATAQRVPPADRPPALRLSGVSAGYNQTAVLRDLSLTVPAGSATALVGPNGAGKSTLLKTVSGLIVPTSGSVELYGADVTALSAHQRAGLGLCHIPEGRAVYRRLTVRENLIMQSVKGEEAAGVERAVTAFPRLGERLQQLAGTLSGGEQQMLALARAYVRRQKLVLVDEASLGLAPVLVDEIFEFLRAQLVADPEVAVLLVDQFVDRALDLADHAYVVRRGEIVFAGEADELKGENLFARYIGAGRP